MRKGFNFYRSYYDVVKQLSDKDKISFLMALFERQFNGVEPSTLTGMALFAYSSQKHSIDSQVIGYEVKTKEKLTPKQGGSVGGRQGGSVQGKEQGKEKVEQAKKKINFSESLIFDKNKFKESFPDWTKEKLLYYYDAALRYSNEGNKYIDWVAAVRTWAKKDELQGKIKFDIKPTHINLGGLV